MYNNFMMDLKNRQEPSCVLCSHTFSFKDSSNPVGARCPLLLQCGHSLCEGCVRSAIRNSTSITCNICSQVSDASKFKNIDDLREEFPLNVYAVGQVAMRRSRYNKTSDQPIGFDKPKKNHVPDNKVMCGECIVEAANCSCYDCNVNLCSRCFQKIHDTAQIFRKHVKMPLAQTHRITDKGTFCEEHKGKYMEVFCKDCNDYCCKDCVFAGHLKHACVEVGQKNQELLQEFSKEFDENNKILNQLYFSRKRKPRPRRAAQLALGQLGQDSATSVTAHCQAGGIGRRAAVANTKIQGFHVQAGVAILGAVHADVHPQQQAQQLQAGGPQRLLQQLQAGGPQRLLQQLQAGGPQRLLQQLQAGGPQLQNKQLATLERQQLQAGGPQLQNKQLATLERQVRVYFSQLHGLLQLQEQEHLKKINKCKNEMQKSIAETLTNVETNIKEMEAVMTTSRALLEPTNFFSVPLSPLLDKLTNTRTEMTCVLLHNNDESNTDTFKFHSDPSLLETLKGHCEIGLPEEITFELCSIGNLPEDFKIETIADIPDQFTKPDLSVLNKKPSKLPIQSASNQMPIPKLTQTEDAKNFTAVQEVLRRNKQTLQNHSKDDTMSTSSAESAFEKICVIPPLVEDVLETVRICHLVSPNDFYIQRKCAYSQLEKLRDLFSKQGNMRKNCLTTIELGQLYLVQFAVDKKWYRAEVKKVFGDKCKIFYVDYGNTETVNVKKLRELPEKYLEIPGQAIHCSLADCAPVGNEWDEEAFKFFTSMSNGRDLSMYVVRINHTSGLHEVHLCNLDDYNASFTDALIYLGCASKTESVDREGGLYKLQPPVTNKKFFEQTGIKKGDTFNCIVTHINTPTNFYIQKVDENCKYLLKLMEDLSLTYSQMSPLENTIFNPRPGLTVAAKYSDGSWYRGIIRSIPMPRYIEVQYVDFGNTETVYWNDVKPLQSKFYKMSVQALKCSLSDVTSKQDKGWSMSAKKAFEKCMGEKFRLRIHVEDVTENNLSVTLYSTKKDKDICINGLLVEQGYAVSVGPCSAQSVVHRKRVARSDFEANSTLPMSRPQSRMSSGVAHTQKKEEESSSEEFGRGAGRVKVIVLKVVSPSELYITFENVQKQILSLCEDMTVFYKSTAEEHRKWEEGDLCAVCSGVNNKWYRGLISEVYEDSYKVYIKDMAEVGECSSEALRTLEPRFNSVMDGSVKCHLSGVMPAGGGKDWTPGTIENFAVIISEDPKAKYYMTKLGDFVDDSLPVQLWAKKMKCQGALKPDIEVWSDIGNLLINLGYAIPDRRSPLRNSDLEPNDNTDESINIQKWLESSFQKSKTSIPNGIPSSPEHSTDEDASKSPYVSELEREEDSKAHNLNQPASSNSVTNLPRQIGYSSLNSNTTDWIPAQPFKNLELACIPSYVDFECAIYLQPSESAGTLELIQRALDDVFKDSAPKPSDQHWEAGEICVAHYRIDDHWYRGKVLRVVDSDQIEVMFVDYGNTDVVHPDQLRKRILMQHIALQCHRCVTDGIIPASRDGKWPLKSLDFIHGTIVSKECLVRLQPPATEGEQYVILTLKVPGGEDLYEVLLSMHYATYIIDCNTVNVDNEEANADSNEQLKSLDLEKLELTDITSEVGCSQGANLTDELCLSTVVLPTFTPFMIPDDVVQLEVQPVLLIALTRVTELIVIVSLADAEDVEVKKYMMEIANLQSELQSNSEERPVILNPVVGMPCVACFTADDQWYRATVSTVLPEDHSVKVSYVDYGNEEVLPIERLREIKEEWTYLPTMSFSVQLHNVTVGPAYQVNRTEMLSDVFKNGTCRMTIKEREPSLQVELFSTTTEELVYQSLLDQNILTRVQVQD